MWDHSDESGGLVGGARSQKVTGLLHCTLADKGPGRRNCAGGMCLVFPADSGVWLPLAALRGADVQIPVTIARNMQEIDHDAQNAS